MAERKDFKDSVYDGIVRIRKSNIEDIRKTKGKKSIAGKLDEIIEFYFTNKFNQNESKQ